MAGALISYKNNADLATISAFNSQTYQANLPLANILDHRVSKKARTASAIANGFSFGLDFGTFSALHKVFGLIGMNFVDNSNSITQNGNTIIVTLKFSNVAIGNADVATVNVNFSDLSPDGMPPSLMFPVNGSTGYFARYISCVASWTPSGGITFFDAGRLWVGDALVLPAGVEEGWQQQIKDESVKVRSRGGQVYADVRARYRHAKIDFKLLTRTQTLNASGAGGVAQEIQAALTKAGVGSEMLIMPRTGSNSTDDLQFLSRFGMYGTLAAEPTITNAPGDVYNVSLEVDESL